MALYKTNDNDRYLVIITHNTLDKLIILLRYWICVAISWLKYVGTLNSDNKKSTLN